MRQRCTLPVVVINSVAQAHHAQQAGQRVVVVPRKRTVHANVAMIQRVHGIRIARPRDTGIDQPVRIRNSYAERVVQIAFAIPQYASCTRTHSSVRSEKT